MTIKLCECGCGQPTRVAPGSDARRGWVRGQPIRFIRGHRARLGTPVATYKMAISDYGARTREHVVIAERVLGKPLPGGAEVHHVNGNIFDNRNCNLVVCDSKGYHALLHARQRALDACGHAGWIRCNRCDRYHAPGDKEHGLTRDEVTEAVIRFYESNRRWPTWHDRGQREFCHLTLNKLFGLPYPEVMRLIRMGFETVYGRPPRQVA